VVISEKAAKKYFAGENPLVYGNKMKVFHHPDDNEEIKGSLDVFISELKKESAIKGLSVSSP